MAGYLSRAIPRLNFKSDEVNRYKLLDGNHAFKFQDVQLALSSWGGKDNLKIRLPNVSEIEMYIIKICGKNQHACFL